ncbi:MAG: energy transducer TonB [Xanthomonadales bacterium]|nr:energy transducer TonB [Xanthomonadales bacterium]MCB1634780.1 energy transducer TonB [Xanthomonadales bacterium]MCB1640333.1 energy transducer TonB [Xanthomonadales bacterium]
MNASFSHWLSGIPKRVLMPVLLAALLAACGGSDPAPVAQTPAQPAPAPVTATTETPATDAEPAEPVIDEALSTSELLDRARTAVAENRLITPADNNAFAYYLRVLENEPRNSAAQVAILELMPLAQGMTEQLIESRDYVAADRAVALLKRAQPTSVVLATLEQRVASYKRADEQRALAEERERQQAEAAAARQTAAATAPTPAPAEPAPAPTPTPAAPAPAPTPPPQQAPTQVASTQPVPSVAQSTAPQNRDVELVQRVNPNYPARALRQQVSGWVDLEFTITEFGDVTDVRVVDADPKRIFDRDAIRAVQAWKFRPKLENGQAVSTTARQRLEFSLGR